MSWSDINFPFVSSLYGVLFFVFGWHWQRLRSTGLQRKKAAEECIAAILRDANRSAAFLWQLESPEHFTIPTPIAHRLHIVPRRDAAL